MGKTFGICLMCAGALMLLALAGYPTASNTLIKAITDVATGGLGWNASTILTLGFLATVAGIFAASFAFSGGQVGLGSFIMTTTDSKLVAPLATFLMVWVPIDLISVYNIANGFGFPWLTTIMGLIIFPMIAAFLIGLVQFWRGSDI